MAANPFLGLAKGKKYFSLHATSSFSSYASFTYEHKQQFLEKKENSCIIRKCCSSFREEEKTDVFKKNGNFFFFSLTSDLGSEPVKW